MSSKIGIFIVLFVVSAFAANEAIKWYTQNDVEKVAAATMPTSTTATITRVMNFSLADTNGTTQNIKQWSDKVRILNFWATWCPPCLRETPMFVELQEKYQDRGLQFIGVAIDSLEPVKEFMDTYGINYPMLIGSEDAIEIAKKYGNKFGALPYSVVIDRNGTIVYAQSGEVKLAKIEPLIKSLL